MLYRGSNCRLGFLYAVTGFKFEHYQLIRTFTVLLKQLVATAALPMQLKDLHKLAPLLAHQRLTCTANTATSAGTDNSITSSSTCLCQSCCQLMITVQNVLPATDIMQTSLAPHQALACTSSSASMVACRSRGRLATDICCTCNVASRSFFSSANMSPRVTVKTPLLLVLRKVVSTSLMVTPGCNGAVRAVSPACQGLLTGQMLVQM